MSVTHLAFELSARCEGGDRVDDDHVERPRTDQHVGYLECLLTGVGLGDEQVVYIDANRTGVSRVHCMLGVYVGAYAAIALSFGDHVHGESALARGLRPEQLNNAAARQAPDAEGQVKGEGTGRDGLNLHVDVFTHAHDGTLAELLLDLA